MLTVFGSLAVGIMFLAYWREGSSKWMVLIFAVASAATSGYSGLVEAYPITVIEGLWSQVALQRFCKRYRAENLATNLGTRRLITEADQD